MMTPARCNSDLSRTNPKNVERLYRSCVLNHRLYYKPPKNKQGVRGPGLRHLKSTKNVYFDEMTKTYKGMCWERNGEVYFCFRGANGLGDIGDALLESSPTPWKYAGFVAGTEHSPKVHRGFLKHYQGLHDLIYSDVKNVLESGNVNKIIFTGHSMGGSIAMLACISSMQQFQLDADIVQCHTFGTPYTGNRDLLNLLPSNTFVVRHVADIVPLIALNSELTALDGFILNPLNKACNYVDDDNNFSMLACDNTSGIDPIQAARQLGLKKLIEYHSCNTYTKGISTIIQSLKHSGLDEVSDADVQNDFPSCIL